MRTTKATQGLLRAWARGMLKACEGKGKAQRVDVIAASLVKAYELGVDDVSQKIQDTVLFGRVRGYR